MAVNDKGFPFDIPFLDWLDCRMHDAEIGFKCPHLRKEKND